MKKSLELKQRKAEVIKEMRGILDKAETEKRSITEEETKEYEAREKMLDTLDADIVRAEKLEKAEEEMRSVEFPAPAVHIPGKTHDEKSFRNIGEFVFTVASNPRDKRLDECRIQQMGDGTLGGFALPPQFRQELMQVQPADAIVRPRATVIPAGSPPDAEITIPALDQTSAQNIYGGITVYHTGESQSVTESNVRLKKVTLKPKKLMGYTTTSNEMLRNWDAFSSLIQTQLRKAINGAEDYDFLRGSGINQALGVINSPACVNYNRATANQIAFADVVGMLARLKYAGSAVWLANQTILPQLANIRDTGNNNLWITAQAGLSQGIPGTLAGIPLIYADRLPALGTKGDLMLVDLANYLIKDGSGPILSVSEHVRFANDETAFRIVWNVDGQPWLTSPIGLEGSTTNTVSPFVVLDVP